MRLRARGYGAGPAGSLSRDLGCVSI